MKTISSWISEWYASRKAMQITFPLTGGTISPITSHSVSVTRNMSSDETVSNTAILWSYPDENDGNLLWHSGIEIAEFGGLVEFSFQLSLDSMQYVLAPVEFNLRRPRLVGALVRQFHCSCGDIRLSLEPREIKAESVGDFVAERLLSSRRRLPIVLVSRTAASGKWLIDPSEFSDQLAGMAETYYLADKWAGFALTDVVGRLYSCFNGAVRIYWPDFDPVQSPFSPVYIPEKLSHIGGKLTDILFRQLAAISAVRSVTGPITIDAKEHLQEERRQEIDKMKAAAAACGDTSALLELAYKDNAELREQNDRLGEQNKSLTEGFDLAQENLRAIFQSRGETNPEPAEVEVEEPGSEPQSVEEAVLAGRNHYGETLVLQESAVDSARQSPFKQSKKVYQALLAMHEVCLAWRKSRRAKSDMGTFEDAFRRKGFVYKSQESVTSRGKWSEEYKTLYNGRRVSIEPHLALGKGGPDTCLRIHFFADELEEKLVIAHVGRHKTNTRT